MSNATHWQAQRLQAASRIHMTLKRQCGYGIDIDRMIRNPVYARDILLLCDASPDTPLEPLGKQFREATEALAAWRRAGATPQPTPWAADTSGFGLTAPPPLTDARSSASADEGAAGNHEGWARRWKQWLQRRSAG